MVRSSLVCAFLSLLLGVFAPAAQAQERPMLAVLDFASGGAELTDEELSLLSDISRAEARRVLGSAYTIITQESIQQLLKAHGKTLEQCQGECETETGKLLGAELVVSGRLVKAFGAYKANLKLHRTDPPELLDARVLTVDTLPGLEGAVKQATAEILASLAPAPTPAASSKPSAPKPSAPKTTSTRETLQRTAKEMAKSLAKRSAKRASDKAATKRAAKRLARATMKKAAKKLAKKKAARKAAKKKAVFLAAARQAAAKRKRTSGSPDWIHESVWLTVQVGPGTIQGDPPEATDVSALFEFLKLRFPLGGTAFWFTNLGAFMMPSATSAQDITMSLQYGSLGLGLGFALDDDLGFEMSVSGANGELDEDGVVSSQRGVMGSAALIWRIEGVPYRLGVMAASLDSGDSSALRTSVVSNWSVGIEF
jgi:hypothetical protein